MLKLVKIILSLSVFISGAVIAEHKDENSEELRDLFKKERAVYYQENPGTAPRGMPRPIADRYQGVSPADYDRRTETARGLLSQLKEIDKTALSSADQINYDMFAYMLESEILFNDYKTWRIPFFSDNGFHTTPLLRWQSENFRSVSDYEAYLTRLASLPELFDTHIANMRQGIAAGWTMPKVVLDGLLATFRSPITHDVTTSTLYGPFKKLAPSINPDQAKMLQEKAIDVLKSKVMPAYRKLLKFMEDDYYPAARESLGASEMPGGRAYYEAMVKYYTTLDVTPEEVHELGLSEVARIRAEMEAIIKDVGFEGSFKDFLTFLRTDPQFYAKSEKELLMHASYIAKKVDGRMPALFGKMPRQPYGVEAVPASIAPNYTTGRYAGAPLDAPRGGYYWVNTYALDKRPLYVLPSLTLHEGVPGHHHQIALSKELENVPEFRLGLYPHAFGEGWGLYAEKLGLDIDIYETPYEQFGRLTYEMWRACRLVIDTGLHAKGWTRDQAIKLLEDNSALSTHNIRTEVDRYISWPGQALAYKMGELTFLKLRKQAEESLGEKFDLRTFHDEVLSYGGIPMDILTKRVDQWIGAQKSE